MFFDTFIGSCSQLLQTSLLVHLGYQFPKTTYLAIIIAAPAGAALLLCIICIMCCVIVCLCVRQSRLKTTRDNYTFQRLSIAAQDSEDEDDDEEQGSEGRP